MHFNIVSIFPEFFSSPLQVGLLARGQEKGLVGFDLFNPRDFSLNKHKNVDDRPYGGGPGMVMALQPLHDCLRAITRPGKVISLSPKGRPLTHKLCHELVREPALTLVCGRYEGIDARLQDIVEIEEVSVGDFVLNGGESAALCLVESVSRLIPGFMGHDDSAGEESFSSGLLEYPHYTRPESYQDLQVPQVLLSGDHQRIAVWRRQKALQTTLDSRPEMFSQAPLSPGDIDFLSSLSRNRPGRNLYLALVHSPVLNKQGQEVTTSLTNLDIHDIARVCVSYGLGGYFICTPLVDQQELASTLLGHWLGGAGEKANPHRGQALQAVRVVDFLQDAVSSITEQCGQKPQVLATSARQGEILFREVGSKLDNGPVLLVFGTGHGLADQVLEHVDGTIRPLRFLDTYNHLSVRSAVAITVDRVLGDIW